MREILFKAKRLDNGEWVEGYYCIKKPYCFDNRIGSKVIIITEHSSTGTVSFEVNPETICQSTGLTDKNGNKIWENDIVKLNEDVKRIFDVDDGVVKYQGGAFFVGEVKTLSSLFVLVDIYYVLRGEVIGDKFDNPELLKGGAE